MTEVFYVDKCTQTAADTLLAFGLAKLLVTAAGEHDLGVTIEDHGDHYRLVMANPLSVEDLVNVRWFSLFQGINTDKQTAALPEHLCVDYKAHQARNQQYFDAKKKTKDDNQLREQGVYPPHRDWSIWAMVNQMSALSAYNKLAEQWYAHRDVYSELMLMVLALFSERPNHVLEAEANWKKLSMGRDISGNAQMPQLQILNSGMGKGGNQSKAVYQQPGGLKGFWLLEYLKFAGLYQAALPYTVKGVKDRKTYILHPKALQWKTHVSVFETFRDRFYAHTAVKMDVLAVLTYCRVFLEQWQAGQGQGRFRLAANPGNHAAGLEVIFYKHMGSAHAVMNSSMLALPEWLGFEATSVAQAQQFLEVVEEHFNLVRNLDESHSDEVTLLRHYRDFLSGRALKPFFKFTRSYAGYVLSKLNAGEYPQQFTTKNLEVIFMVHEPKFEPILRNEGFLHIAEAVRRSTVSPQYQKSRGSDPLYAIRYGLGDKLVRAATNPGSFLQAVGKFIHDYNRENAQKNETRKVQYRKNITTTDIEGLTALVDEYGPAVIANLLVAYGYARESKEDNQIEQEGEN